MGKYLKYPTIKIVVALNFRINLVFICFYHSPSRDHQCFPHPGCSHLGADLLHHADLQALLRLVPGWHHSGRFCRQLAVCLLPHRHVQPGNGHVWQELSNQTARSFGVLGERHGRFRYGASGVRHHLPDLLRRRRLLCQQNLTEGPQRSGTGRGVCRQKEAKMSNSCMTTC
jgi:hypothetical protein